MNINQTKSTDAVIDHSQPDGDHSGVLVLLNEAREDQRRNSANVFSSRLQVLATYIIKHEMTVIEAVEALRVEAERLQNEAAEIH